MCVTHEGQNYLLVLVLVVRHLLQITFVITLFCLYICSHISQ